MIKEKFMGKIVYQSTKKREHLPSLLEGYLYGLGEACHRLFGAQGEAAIYEAIGRYYIIYLKEKLGIEFLELEPWDRYCRIIETFTSYGFYSYVELERISENTYWMLETGQYAGDVWEEQKAWERGTPPCPLWATILYSLSEIDYKIELDSVSYREEFKGYESTFHFEKIPPKTDDPLLNAKKAIRASLIPICCNCKKIRNDNNQWENADVYFSQNFDAKFTHSICSECAEKLYSNINVE